MRKLALSLAILSLAGFVACKHDDPKTRVEAAIQAHLMQNAHLTPDSFTTHFERVSINGATAEAVVKYESRKVPNLAVQVSYGLKKINGQWQVVTSSSAGGQMTSPANPHRAPSLDQTPAPVPSH
ncbi:MAG: hypothetical protein ACRD3D_01920 [Terriglobia bacterium]